MRYLLIDLQNPFRQVEGNSKNVPDFNLNKKTYIIADKVYKHGYDLEGIQSYDWWQLKTKILVCLYEDKDIL